MRPATEALVADSAGLSRVQGDPVPWLHPCHRRADFYHRTGTLMADRPRILDPLTSDAALREVMHVRSADTDTRHLDEDVRIS